MSATDQNPSPPLKSQRHTTPCLLCLPDALGNLHEVGISLDVFHVGETLRYVASITGGRKRKMASGAYKAPIVASGVGETPESAAQSCMAIYNKDRFPGP